MLSFIPTSTRKRREVAPETENPSGFEAEEELTEKEIELIKSMEKEQLEEAEEAVPVKRQKQEPTISVFGELLVIALALGSIAATSSSYTLLGKSASYVEPILRNWQTKPVGYIAFAYPNGSCPAGTEGGRTELTWPGVGSLGCACPSSSGFSSVSGSACDNARTVAGCTDGSVTAPLTMDSWRGTKICLNRTGQAVASFDSDSEVVLRPTPDTEIPHQCAAGYRRCGRTSLDAWRSTCTPENDACPLTFAGSEKMIGAYGATVAKFEAHTFSRDVQPFYNRTGGNENATLYVAESSLVVMQQLPLVEFLVSFMQTGSQVGSYNVYGPCLNYLADYRGNSQANYAGSATYSTSGDPRRIRNDYPGACDRVDPRWIAYDHQEETSFLFENVLGHEYCEGLNYTQAQSTNYWYSGATCTTDTSAPVARQCHYGGYTHLSALRSCASGDSVCQDEYLQSKCGKLMQTVSAIAAQNAADDREMTVGLFKRSEIYWKEKCTADYLSVKENNEPLQQALYAQMSLLIVNVVLNMVTITVSVVVLFIYELQVDIPCIDGSAKEDALFLKLLNRRVSLVAKVFKLGPIIAAIVLLSYVVDFYTEIAASNCSDDTTNEAFTALGETLPSTQTGNYATLCMDVLQIFIPFMLYLRIVRAKQQLKSKQLLEGTNEEHARHLNNKPEKSILETLEEEDSGDSEEEKRGATVFDADSDSNDDDEAVVVESEVSIRKPKRPPRTPRRQQTLMLRAPHAATADAALAKASLATDTKVAEKGVASAPRSFVGRISDAFLDLTAPAGVTRDKRKVVKRAKPWQQV